MNPGWTPTYDLGESIEVELPGRGSTTAWDSGDPGNGENTDAVLENTDPVLLLHGWNIDAPTNYGFAFPHLRTKRRVVMYDQQGHGHGPRHDAPFTLEAVAGDAITVLDSLGIERAIIAGYSLGGAVAQTVAHNHPDRCSGLVLSATSARFAETRKETVEFKALATFARLLRRVPAAGRAQLFAAILAVTTRKYPAWIAEVVRNGDPINLLEAGASLGTFDSTSWTELADLPTAFVVTAKDEIVPPPRQVQLATALDVESMHNVDAGHEVPILNNEAFNTALADAIDAVSNESHTTEQAG